MYQKGLTFGIRFHEDGSYRSAAAAVVQNQVQLGVDPVYTTTLPNNLAAERSTLAQI